LTGNQILNFREIWLIPIRTAALLVAESGFELERPE
jgi:hypothetical protein